MARGGIGAATGGNTGLGGMEFARGGGEMLLRGGRIRQFRFRLRRESCGAGACGT